MKNILWHTWEPGLEGNLKTSGGGAVWTRHLWRYFKRNGYNTQYMTVKDRGPLEDGWKPEIKPDFAVFCWRWQLPDAPQYAERNMIYERQDMLLKWCIDNKVPFLIHDQDLKMTPRERGMVIYNGGVIATPSFFPDTEEVSLHFPNPYRLRILPQVQFDDMVYIGNNYERMDQTVRLTTGFSNNVKTFFYGNWVESGPGRDPEKVKQLLPNVVFMGRLDQSKVIEQLSISRATMMLHKEEYGPRGFTTIRWAEAATAGILTFIPAEFALPKQYSHSLHMLRVSDGPEMLTRYNSISKEDELPLINELRSLVATYMAPEPWLRIIERMTT